MSFEWDDRKAELNVATHGVPFEFAARVFLDPHRLDGQDARRDYSEPRRITLGEIEGRLFVVAYTMRGQLIRLIRLERRTVVKRGSMKRRYKLDPKKPRKLTPASARRLDKTAIDYSDIPPLGDEFFAKAAADRVAVKHQLTIRLDADVLNWLKSNGRGYQTRINRILRAAMTYSKVDII